MNWIEIPTTDWEQTRALLTKHYTVLRAQGNFTRVWVLLGPAVNDQTATI
jgi:hypothetical protein